MWCAACDEEKKLEELVFGKDILAESLDTGAGAKKKVDKVSEGVRE
jgi:hypothetical protein